MLSLGVVGAVAWTAGCNKAETPAGAATAAASSAPVASALAAAPGAAGCTGHAVCADNYFIDAVAPEECAVGALCNVVFKLVATGNYHVNEEYPYRFKAADAPGVLFAGSDPAGKNVFSKPAGDWRKLDEKGGAMTVKFTVADKSPKTIGGTFKLSVCSPAACLLEQRDVSAAVAAR
jgi:hypothetical protein